VFNRDQETLTTSLAVADAYGKQHRNVLQAIDNIIQSHGLKFSQGIFVFREAVYGSRRGREDRMVEMNEEAFTLLVGGFTGIACPAPLPAPILGECSW
jgi:Rha family phage regulatory protein